MSTVAAVPPAVVALMSAALDDYRLLTPPGEQTPHGQAVHVGEYLASSGYEVRPADGPNSRQEPAA